MILGKEVLIENDVSDRDKYQRLLGYIYLNEEFVNEEIVRQGWARAYPYAPDTKLCSKMQEAEKQAKQEKLGMWQEYEKPIPSGKYNCTSNAYVRNAH